MINVRDEDLLRKFGIQLSAVRQKLKFTQRELAYSSDISISQISRIERGLINPTLSTMNRLADTMGVPLKELCDFD